MRSNWRRGSKCLVDVKFKSPVAKTEMLPDQTKNDVRREEREKPLARAAGRGGVVSPARSVLLTGRQGVAVAASKLTYRHLQLYKE